MLSNIPNILTVLRLLSVYPLIIFILEEQFFLALGIFFLAGVSDFLDGFLAINYSCISKSNSDKRRGFSTVPKNILSPLLNFIYFVIIILISL